MTHDRDAEKRNAAIAALDYVESGMTLGIGTGSTANLFIEALGEKIAGGWSIKGVPTSVETERRAKAIGVDIIIPDETTIIDVAIDGADEADPSLHLIKGGGAALLREKIIANAAKKFVVIADKSKRVAHLGAFPLPVEIDAYAWALTVRAVRNVLEAQGFDGTKATLRISEGKPLITDGGNLILDCQLDRIENPPALEAALNALPGVVENGLFCGMAACALYGAPHGVDAVAA